MTDSLQTISSQYTGPVTLNNRSLHSTLDIINGSVENNKISSDQVSDLMNFLEAYILSNKIYFDGTVPKEQLETTINKTKVLEKKFSFIKTNKNNIKPIIYSSSSDILSRCSEAVDEASQIILNITPNTITNTHPIDLNSAELFLSALSNAKTMNHNDRSSYAVELIHNNEFLGSKCVAGLITSSLPYHEFSNLITEQILSTKNSNYQKIRITAEVINRFRANYINAISAEHSSAYVAHPTIENIKDQQSFLLWRYLGKKIFNHSTYKLPEEVKSNLSNESKYFPFAYALLMQSDINSPHELIERANSLRDKTFNRLMLSEDGSKQRFIHDFDISDFDEMEDSLFRKTFLKIISPDQLTIKTKRVNLPAFISACSVISGGFIPNSFIEMLVEIGINTAGKIINTGGREKQKINIYRNNFNRWQQLFSSSVDNHIGYEITFKSRIEDIFKVKVCD